MSFLTKTKITSVVVFLGLTIVFPPIAEALSSQRFINQMRTKFRRTATIYLEAESHRLHDDGPPSDTMNVTLAYSYPEQIVQHVRGDRNRQQILLYNGDSMVLSYPHIGVERRRSVTRKQFGRALVEQVPFSSLFLSLASDRISSDSISVKTKPRTLVIQYPPSAESSEQPVKIEATFTRNELHPRTFIIENRSGRFRVRITDYREEERFPPAVEEALNRMNPAFLEDRQS